MKRREAIKNSILWVGGFMTFGSAITFSSSCRNSAKQGGSSWLSQEETSLLEEVVDTFIPATDTPGAREAGVATFVIYMIEDCYPQETQEVIKTGLKELNTLAKGQFNQPFLKLNEAEKDEVLHSMQIGNAEFYRLVQQLTNMGYYTSEIGATQALDFVFVPGKYNPCLIIDSNQKAWAM